MGNPFVLSEDEFPTVTLGIVSGVNRFQEGGANQLVYGNCLQVDSAINPGNSGGPLFDLHGQVIGINGRGSFDVRGRVNVGLGYAISANQIKNFLPDLMASKLVEHGTLDATFDERQGHVVCASIDEDSAIARGGLQLGDRLIAFEDQPMVRVNQYLNLICTLPENWPAKLEIERADGSRHTLIVRLYGLPYNFQAPPSPPEPKDEPTPEEKQARQRQQQMIALMTSPPGKVRDAEINAHWTRWLLDRWRARRAALRLLRPCG